MRWSLSAAALSLWCLSWALVPALDATRHARHIDTVLLYPPDGRQLRMFATGQEEVLADILWVRTVLVFGERFDQVNTPTDQRRWTGWLRQMIQAANILDPLWNTPYFYGGVMLRVAGDVGSSDAVLKDGFRHLPDNWFFPFSLGMNAYIYRNDREEAAYWLQQAVGLPGAPGWYAAAAAAMQADSGGRKAAMKYLKQVLDSTNDPAIREDTTRQLNRLYHDDLVDTWDDACRDWYTQRGRPLDRPEDLSLLGVGELPPNPRGDRWIVGRDGVVRSERADDELWHDHIKLEMALIGR